MNDANSEVEAEAVQLYNAVAAAADKGSNVMPRPHPNFEHSSCPTKPVRDGRAAPTYARLRLGAEGGTRVRYRGKSTIAAEAGRRTLGIEPEEAARMKNRRRSWCSLVRSPELVRVRLRVLAASGRMRAYGTSSTNVCGQSV